MRYWALILGPAGILAGLLVVFGVVHGAAGLALASLSLLLGLTGIWAARRR
jgi:hypothetical protein